MSSTTPPKSKKSVLPVDVRLSYLLGKARKNPHQKFIALTMKDAEAILTVLKNPTIPMPKSVREP
jgi:hypothetical protein